MTTFEPGDVVLVRFPFTDLTAAKKRPALVISTIDFSRRFNDVILIALTSQPQDEADLLLQDWRVAGLPKATWLKPLVATIANDLVDRRLGRISAADRTKVGAMLHRVIASVFDQ